MIVAAPAFNESTSIVGIFVVSMPVNSLRFCTESVEAFALFSALIELCNCFASSEFLSEISAYFASSVFIDAAIESELFFAAVFAALIV